jgi:hypothetical protein
MPGLLTARQRLLLALDIAISAGLLLLGYRLTHWGN